MKKIGFIAFIFLLIGCSEDNTSHEGTINIISTGFNYANNNGVYSSYFSATVVNTTHAPVKGHVRFEIKEYGYINSSTETVTNEKGHQKTFFATLETDKIIDESYLVKAEFVRE